jgi:hypothetical protein
MKKSKKAVLIVILILICVILATFIYRMKNNQVVKKSTEKSTEPNLIIPTTDASTVVTLTPVDSGKEVQLKIMGIPTDTKMIKYELSYSTKQQGFQGVIGTISPGNKKEFEKNITLGTCSSGRCVYHEVVGSVKTTLKFSGGYGEKILEKEFTL